MVLGGLVDGWGGFGEVEAGADVCLSPVCVDDGYPVAAWPVADGSVGEGDGE